MSRRRIFALTAAAVLFLAPISACARSAESAVSPPQIGSEGPLTDAALPEGGAAGAQRAEDGTGADTLADRAIIRSGDLSLIVGDLAAASERVTAAANELGGNIDSETLAQDSANLTVRVPAERLDEAFALLSGIGKVQSQSRSAADVTTVHVDLDARVAALEASVQRLNALIADASTTADLIEAETALTNRQQELDGLRAQLTALEDQVAEATIWVTLSPEQVLPGGGPATFWDGVVSGFQSLGTVGAGALVVLGVLLPWLVLGGIIAGLVVWIVRAVRRRRVPRRATATPPHTPAEPGAADPARSDPAGSDPVRSDPARSDHAPSGPAPSGPAPSGPAPSGPAPSGPAPSGPVASRLPASDHAHPGPERSDS